MPLLVSHQTATNLLNIAPSYAIAAVCEKATAALYRKDSEKFGAPGKPASQPPKTVGAHVLNMTRDAFQTSEAVGYCGIFGWSLFKCISGFKNTKVPFFNVALKSTMPHILLATVGLSLWEAFVVKPMLKVAADPKVNSGLLQLCAMTLFAAGLVVGEAARVQFVLLIHFYGILSGIAGACAGLLIGSVVALNARADRSPAPRPA